MDLTSRMNSTAARRESVTLGVADSLIGSSGTANATGVEDLCVSPRGGISDGFGHTTGGEPCRLWRAAPLRVLSLRVSDVLLAGGEDNT